ncbi:MAG: H-X9-DG-CTERM domain-containing protein [Candidatus Omnitrophota bacterium]
MKKFLLYAATGLIVFAGCNLSTTKSTVWSATTAGDKNHYCFWMVRLAPYLGYTDTTGLLPYGGEENSVDNRMKVLQCPTTWRLVPLSWPGHSYGMNRYFVSDQNTGTYRTPAKLTSVSANITQFYVASDCVRYSPLCDGESVYHSYYFTATLNNTGGHSLGLNFLMGDGHVEYHKKTEGFRVLWAPGGVEPDLWTTWDEGHD